MEGAATVPYFWVFVAAAVAALLIEIVALRATTRRLRAQKELSRQAAAGRGEALAVPVVPSRVPELAAALAPLVVAGILITPADQGAEERTVLDPKQFATCRDLGARLVDLRRQGKKVALKVPR